MAAATKPGGAASAKAAARPPTVSLLDRLIDLDPDRETDPPVTVAAALRAARDSVRRDLETLLNTQHGVEAAQAALPEIETSLLRYGTPGFHGLMLATRQQQLALAAAIRGLVNVFEPRLADVIVELGDPKSEGQRALHLRIRGRLRLGRHNETIAFDTHLDPSTRHFRLEG